MATWKNVHLLFCEGPHDVAFLNRLLKKSLGFKQKNLQVSELPYPVGDVLKQSFQTRAAEDLRLDLAKKFFLPDRVLEHEGILVLLFNYGGSNLKNNLPPFLSKVFTLLAASAFSGGAQVPLSYVVFADADAAGTKPARQSISASLKKIEGQDWLTTEWTELANLPMAAEQQTPQGRVGAYIWRKQDADQGTLEDIVLECMGDPAATPLEQTIQFVDSRFNWISAAQATPVETCALGAKRLKAIFCVEGQGQNPGSSLAVILDRSDLLSTERLNASVSVQCCVKFLQTWLAIDAV